MKGTDKEGTVEMFRPFGDSISIEASANLHEWIIKHERPTVFPFDDRTIGSIFGDRGTGVILFHSGQAEEALAEAFRDAAAEVRNNQGKVHLIFTDIEVSILKVDKCRAL